MQQALGQDSRYRIVRRIDVGGMGEIWEADDTLLGRRVAIKVLAEELAGDRVALRRFRREARATAKLDHPNVIRVFDFVDGEAPSWSLSCWKATPWPTGCAATAPYHRPKRPGSRRRWPTGWTWPTGPGSSTAISSRATSCSRPAAG